MSGDEETGERVFNATVEDEKSTKPFRILIRAHVLQIPGDKDGRSFTLGKIAFPRILGREMQTTKETGFDAVHCIANVNTENDVKAWFLYNVNCVEKMDQEAVKKIPLTFYLAHKDGDDWYCYCCLPRLSANQLKGSSLSALPTKVM